MVALGSVAASVCPLHVRALTNVLLPLTLEPAMRAMPMDSLRFIPPLRNLHRESRLSSRLRMCSICFTSSGHLWRDKPFSCNGKGQRDVAGAMTFVWQAT